MASHVVVFGAKSLGPCEVFISPNLDFGRDHASPSDLAQCASLLDYELKLGEM